MTIYSFRVNVFNSNLKTKAGPLNAVNGYVNVRLALSDKKNVAVNLRKTAKKIPWYNVF